MTLWKKYILYNNIIKEYPIEYNLKKIKKRIKLQHPQQKINLIIKIFKQWQRHCEKILKFDIYTNYKNFEYFTIMKIFNRQQIWWMEFLNKFNFINYYILDWKNGHLDILINI